ncbi:MAG: hypothetical protein DRJ63_01880 [Thermoprotei archaeon]|nr:MAG: hypothetical protein DRJ63_01880 [Thermoprotei archaeon]
MSCGRSVAGRIAFDLVCSEFAELCSELDFLLEKLKFLIKVVKDRYCLDEFDAGFSVSRLFELGSFEKYVSVMDPRCFVSLRKVFRAYDEGRIDGLEFFDRVRAAVRLSLNIKFRDLYELFVLLSLLVELGERGAVLEYPRGRIVLSRSSRLGWIPANIVLRIGGDYLSLFFEALRPVESKGIPRYRPDIMVYGGNIVEIFFDGMKIIPCPDYVIEVESGVEWFRKSNIRVYGSVANVDLIRKYLKVFKPRKLIVVSRVGVPSDIKEKLRRCGIVIVDNVEYDYNVLGRRLVSTLH